MELQQAERPVEPEIVPAAQEEPRQAPAAPSSPSMSINGAQQQAEQAGVVEPEIVPAAATPSPSTSMPVDETQQQARGRLDLESGVVSPSLRTAATSAPSGSTPPSSPPPANNWRRSLCVSAHPKYVKWVYAATIYGGLAWGIYSRDRELARFNKDTNGFDDNRELLGPESALRLSLGFVWFFTVMFVTTVWTNKVDACRNVWNSNLGWPLLVKIGLMAGCQYVVQILPARSIDVYGNVARAGAGLYLAIQLITVTKFIVFLNTFHPSNPERRRWTACRRWLMKAGAILSNFGSFGLNLWLIHTHKSNIVDFAITGITLMLILIMIIIRLKSEVTAGWLAPGLMISYVVLMCWTVITSEPHGPRDPKSPDWLTIVSLIFLGYSIFSTAMDEWLQFKEVPSADDLPYGFGYFHLVLALGSMYFGMILVGWNPHQRMERGTIDYGWWSAVVRAVNGLLAAMLYIWMLRTPFIWNKKKLVVSLCRPSRMPRVTFL